MQAPVGDTWSHPYAVVTDGRLHLGLHGYEFESPSLTWVRPDLAVHAAALESLGIEFAFAKLGDEALHELGFLDPSGQMITLIEARTFSPPAFARRPPSRSDISRSSACRPRTSTARPRSGTRSGFVAFDPIRAPFAKVVASHRDLNVGLYDTDLKRPVLTFSDPRMPERIAELRGQGPSLRQTGCRAA